MPTLLLARSGVTTPAPFVGHVRVVLPEPSAVGLIDLGLDPAQLGARWSTDRAAFWDALGLADLLAGVGRPSCIGLLGLHAPTPWESAFVDAVRCRLGVGAADCAAVYPASEGGFGAVGAALADPLTRWPDAPPDGLRLFHADDIRLEAMGVARAVRAQLQGLAPDAQAPFLSDTLVLVPDDPARVATWRRALEAQGMPVDSETRLALVDSPVARWLLALAGVAGWAERPVSRATLRAVFLSPYLPLGGARRSDLQRLLRALRRPSVTLAEWQAHIRGYFQGLARDAVARDGVADLTLDDRRGAVLERSRGLAARLGDPDQPGRWLRLLGLLGDRGDDALRLRARTRVSASAPGGVDAMRAAGRCLDVIGDLAEAARQGSDDAGAMADRLAAGLSATGLRMGAPVVDGIRLRRWSRWSGRGAARVVLAGLDEGGYPRAPGRRTGADARLAAAIGLLDGADELERQARVAALAARSAQEQLWLSWSRTDAQGSQTFPGALVAAAPTLQKSVPPAWASVAQRIDDRRVSPGDPADAMGPAELLPFAGLVALPADVGESSAWSAAHGLSATVRRIDAARAPSAPAAPGPYTGVVGVPLFTPDQHFSPTALEQLGACPTRYLLGRVLGGAEASDAESLLDAMEAGSLVHAGLAGPAQAAAGRGASWSLAGAGPGAVDARMGAVSAAIDDELDALLGDQPTLGRGLTAALAQRWKLAVRAALDQAATQGPGGVFAAGAAPAVGDVTSDQLEALLPGLGKGDSGAVAVVLRDRAAAPALDAALADALEVEFKTPAAAAAWLKQRALPKAVAMNATLFKGLAQRSRDERAVLLDEIGEKARGPMRARAAKLDGLVRKAWAADRQSVAPNVVAAEWSFGRPADRGADPRSVPEPLILTLDDGVALRVHGQVDRVDAATDRSDLAVVDYKTGKTRSDGRLQSAFAEGHHLQLPLYAAAVEALWPGRAPGARVVVGRLDFVRKQKHASLWLEDAGMSWVAPGDVPGAAASPLTARDVLRSHLTHSVALLRSGVLPLAPRSCPLRGDPDAHCDFQQVCGWVPTAPAVADVAPHFVENVAAKVPSARPAKPPPELRYQPLAPAPNPPDAVAAKSAHEAARDRACDANVDVFVSAGAGSGKTTALVSRYLAALAPDDPVGPDPNDILAITFTRRATAEMRGRVRAALLERAAAGRGDPARLRRLLRQVGAAPILTIDAFCGWVVGELTDSAVAVGADVAVISDAWLSTRLVDAAEAPDADLRALLQAWPPAEVRAVLRALVDQPGAVADLAGLSPPALAARQIAAAKAGRPALQADVNACATQADVARRLGAGDLEAGLVSVVDAWDAMGPAGAVWQLARLMALAKTPKGASDELADAHGVIDLALRRWVMTGGTLKALADVVKGCDTLAALRERLDQEAAVGLASVRLARRWGAELAEHRAERGQLGFDDLLRRALELATERGVELAQLMPFRQLMVDEFQDTSATQVALVDAVAAALSAHGEHAPRRFQVGDPKQSIYRFRGAEVSVFEGALDSAADRGVRVEELSVCWRARPALTRSIDRLFCRVLEARRSTGALADPEARVPWIALAPRPESPTDPTGPCVELLVGGGGDAVDHSDGDAPVETVAVPELTGMDVAVIARLGDLRAAHPDWSVAVLTHSWARAAHWGQVLQDAGLPAFVQGGRGLLKAPEVVPLMQALRALATEDDDLAWLGLLRGPLVGLSDPGLLCLRLGVGVSLRAAGEWAPAGGRLRLSRARQGVRLDAEAAAQALAELSGRPVSSDVSAALQSDARRLDAFTAWWTPARAGWGRVSLAASLAAVIDGAGYRAVMQQRAGSAGVAAGQSAVRLRSFEALVADVDAGAVRTPSEAVRELERLDKLGEDPAAGGRSLHAGQAIAVTVVHQSKGLEWDAVVVPDLDRAVVRNRVDHKRPIRRPRETSWVIGSRVVDGSDPFQLSAGVGGQLATIAGRGAERAENRRLLYVACTRAKELLMLGGPWPRGEGGDVDLRKRAQKRAPHRRWGLADSHSWFEDVVISLGLHVPDGAELPDTDGTWVRGRDFRWVMPPGEGLAALGGGLDTPASGGKTLSADALRRGLAFVPLRLVERRNPSGQKGGDLPAPWVASSGGDPLAGETPFRDARVEGTAAHRALELCDHRHDLDLGLCARALGPGFSDAHAQWIHRLLRHAFAGQPGLVSELRAAAAAGRLFHEVELRVPIADAPARWEGSVDLLWQDDGGRWHLIDYKAAEVGLHDAVDGQAGRNHHLRRYHPQVRAYADALSGHLPGGAAVATYGLWFLKDGGLVRWSTVR